MSLLGSKVDPKKVQEGLDMTTILQSPLKVTAQTAVPLARNDRLESVALALEGRGEEMLIGMQGIETREILALYASPSKPGPFEVATKLIDTGYVLNCKIDGTIFGAIADELEQLQLDGRKLDTIGQVAEALGIDTSDHKGARKAIHLLGCWCMGEVVKASEVGRRIRNLKS